MDILYPTRNPRTEDTHIGYTISIGSLATALILSLVVFMTVIVATLTRSRTKIKAELTSRAERNIHMESVSEDVTGPIPSVSIINTQDNTAYGQIKTSITTI